MAAITAAALVAGSTVYGVSQQRKAAKEASRAAERAAVDPEMVAQRAREQSIRNLRESFAAEEEFLPEQAQFRRISTSNLARLAGEGDAGAQEQIRGVEEQISAGGTAPRSSLLSSAIARAGEDLAQGGRLSADVRGEVARSALANASRVGGGRLSLGRFILPRNIGVSSLGLSQQRLATAGQLGQVEQGLNQTDFENLIRLRSLRDALGSSSFTRQLQLGQFGQQLQAPQIGLDAGDYASLYVQNQNVRTNAAQQAAQLRAAGGQNYAQAGSALGGLAGAVGSQFFSGGGSGVVTPAAGTSRVRIA